MHSISCSYETDGISPNMMRIGQVGIVSQPFGGLCTGSYLMRTYSGWVVLNDPSSTYCLGSKWQSGPNNACKVKIVPEGAIITIKVGKTNEN